MRFQLLLPFFLLLVLNACKKDTKEKEPESELTACINGPSQVETSTGNTFSWCGSGVEEVEWILSGTNTKVVGSSFTPTFSTKGKQLIIATGKYSGRTVEARLEVNYGKNSKIICRISSLLPLQGDKKKYVAYLYNSHADWTKDATIGNHLSAVDSVHCRDTATISGFPLFAIFKNVYTTGSSKLVSVEYRDPSKPAMRESNWYHAFGSTNGHVLIKNTDYINDTCSTFIDGYSKWILTMKWNLVEIDTGNGLGTATDCLSDDYVRFYADGSWSYFTHDNHCNSPDLPSRGRFTKIPYLLEGSVSAMHAEEGPLKKFGPYGWEITNSFVSRFYLNPNGFYVFSPGW